MDGGNRVAVSDFESSRGYQQTIYPFMANYSGVQMPKIDNSYFGSIIIDGRKFDGDVVISWDGRIESRPGSHTFTKVDLNELLMRDPEVIVVGTGTVGNVKVEPAAEVAARLAGIELIAKLTPAAISEFNRHVRRKRAIGVMHVTC